MLLTKKFYMLSLFSAIFIIWKKNRSVNANVFLRLLAKYPGRTCDSFWLWPKIFKTIETHSKVTRNFPLCDFDTTRVLGEKLQDARNYSISNNNVTLGNMALRILALGIMSWRRQFRHVGFYRDTTIILKHQ